MKSIFLALIVTGTLNAQGHTLYRYDYEGKPGDVVNYSVPVKPNSVVQFDFCTMNVPDRLTVGIPDGDISFYIGTNITQGELNLYDDYYRGYAELIWDDSLTTLLNNYPEPPLNFDCTELMLIRPPTGTLRLTYTTDENQCVLRFKVEGNKDERTVYNLTLTLLEEGFDTSNDTIVVNTCKATSDGWKNTACGPKYFIYNDYGIYTSALITHPSCIGSLDGSITFYNYPQYNLYNVPVGNYDITVSNGVCEEKFNIKLESDSLCNRYIPNAFFPEKDEFLMFTPESTPYLLYIFDRWGSLLFAKQCVTNLSGWDGTDALPGVYTYYVVYFDVIFKGDVTLFR